MPNRLIDMAGRYLAELRGSALVEAIRLSEGRTIAAETISCAGPLLDKVSNPELVAAAGADIIVLNIYDVNAPWVAGIQPSRSTLEEVPAFGQVASAARVTAGDVAQWTGRVVAVNLEPVGTEATGFPNGRRANAANALAAAEQGATMIVVTGNPGTGVTMDAIARATEQMRSATADKIVYFAGRIHAAATDEIPVQGRDIELLARAGAHGVVVPAPNTTPGSSIPACLELVHGAHQAKMLAWSGIGTSQEGATTSVIERIALDSKSTGADIHHIGDSGFFGIAPPENIYTYSLAIRGRRHTWFRMAASAHR